MPGIAVVALVPRFLEALHRPGMGQLNRPAGQRLQPGRKIRRPAAGFDRHPQHLIAHASTANITKLGLLGTFRFISTTPSSSIAHTRIVSS